MLNEKLWKFKDDSITSNIKDSKYFYLRDAANVPLVTICSLKFNDKWYKGFSFCSTSDCVNKRKGREIAFGRAIFAIKASVPFYYGTRINKKILKRINVTEEDFGSLFNNYMFFPPPKTK